MRLIDADILIEKLKSYAECDWNKSLCVMLPSVVYDCIEFVDEQPTAYSVDKVVEELKCDRCESCNFLELCAGSKCCGKCHEKAIEIVKQGGVSDDVCEWEKGFSGYVGYPAYYSKCCTTNSKGLEMQTHIIADWKFCPYCGKKIKVVDN